MRIPVPTLHKEGGFTLLEILLVVGIVAVLLAVIVPQAIRINTNSKYSIVQQAAAEIGKWGLEWGERNLESQGAADTCVLNDYINSLSGGYVGNVSGNWTDTPNAAPVLVTPVCRTSAPIQYSVAAMVDPGRQPRNPFNGVSYFSTINNGTTLYPGLLYLADSVDGTTAPPTHHYYFVYTGTESLNASQWHAGMGSGLVPPLANLRNGIFMARMVE